MEKKKCFKCSRGYPGNCKREDCANYSGETEEWEEEMRLWMHGLASGTYSEEEIGTQIANIHFLILKAKDDGAPNIPMGVSQWMNYGEKYGYDKYFAAKIREEERDRILAAIEGERGVLTLDSTGDAILRAYNGGIQRALEVAAIEQEKKPADD